jgi:hypothetical protein
VRAKLAEVTELLDGAIEAARLLGQTQALAGSLFNRSVIAVAVGDLDNAVTTAQESVDLARDLDEGFVPAWAAVRLAGALLETGRPESAVELLLGCAGGEEQALIPGSWSAYCLELLISRCACSACCGPSSIRIWKRRGRAPLDELCPIARGHALGSPEPRDCEPSPAGF